jgi:hypothetical protein
VASSVPRVGFCNVSQLPTVAGGESGGTAASRRSLRSSASDADRDPRFHAAFSICSPDGRTHGRHKRSIWDSSGAADSACQGSRRSLGDLLTDETLDRLSPGLVGYELDGVPAPL